MKNKFIRALLALALTLGFVATPHVASEAASIFIATVKIADVEGRPVSGTTFNVTTYSPKGATLWIEATTNSRGEAKVQVYPGEYRLDVFMGLRCFMLPEVQTGIIDKSDPNIYLQTPKLRNFKFQLLTESGLPIPNQQVSLVSPKFEDGFYCGQTIDKSDINGVVTIYTFALDMSKYLDDNYPNVEQMRTAFVYIQPFDNVWVTQLVDFEEWIDGYAEVVVEDVPSLTTKAPTEVSPNSYFNIYGTIMNADGTASNASVKKAAPVRSFYRTALLWQRELIKGRWSQWKQVKSVRVDSRGKALFTKIKIKNTSQFQVRGNAFSLGTKVALVKVKAK